MSLFLLVLLLLLLEAGADVKSKPAKTTGETALAAAASTGNIQLVQLLLDHGADVNVPAIRHKVSLDIYSSTILASAGVEISVLRVAWTVLLSRAKISRL